MDVKKQDLGMKETMNNEKMSIERERLATQRDIANKQLEIARTNKNKYDTGGNKK
jgi:hypothetical protein